MRTLLLALFCLTTAAQAVPVLHRIPRAITPKRYDQSISLHPGWNLVSWHVDILDPNPIQNPLIMSEILPGPPSWLADNAGEVHRWTSRNLFYPNNPPQSANWEWDLDYAYYMHLDVSHTWLFSNRPRIPLAAVTFDPDPAWDSNVLDR